MLLASSIAVAQAPICTAPRIDRTRSLAVTDAALDKTKFSFSRTIGAILSSMGILNTADNQENFLKTLLASFNNDVLVNPVSGLRMRLDRRPLAAALDPKKLLDPHDLTGLVPVALFNRLDLAPVDWSDCGEHRIVYSFNAPIPSTASSLLTRFFLIFEARTAPSPQKTGFEGCRATADFWRNLTDEKNAAKRAELLERFYYTGIEGTAGPVVQAKNYGGPLGQVRGNFSVTAPDAPASDPSSKFQLREWIIVNSGQPTPASFVSMTVKDNPLAQFYLDVNGTDSLNPTLEASERVEFHKEFLNTSLKRLLQPDVDRNRLTPGEPHYKPELDPKNAAFDEDKYEIEILNRFAADFPNRFNAFQSVSQGDEDNPEAKAGIGFRADIDAKLGQFAIDPMQKPKAKHVLNRAGAVTCGGCHQFTTTEPVGQVGGKPIKWPDSGIFVHVTERGELSPALNKVFLPFREDRLAEAVCIPIGMAATATAQTVSDIAAQTGWQQLLADARDKKDEAKQREAIQAITVQRQEAMQKSGYFVTNRRPH
jgi:hypothetical protein